MSNLAEFYLRLEEILNFFQCDGVLSRIDITITKSSVLTGAATDKLTGRVSFYFGDVLQCESKFQNLKPVDIIDKITKDVKSYVSNCRTMLTEDLASTKLKLNLIDTIERHPLHLLAEQAAGRQL